MEDSWSGVVEETKVGGNVSLQWMEESESQ